MKGVAVLGATGSVGVSTLDVLARHPQRFEIVALAARSDGARLAEQCLRYRPALAALADPVAARELRVRLRTEGCPTEVLEGPEALEALARDPRTDIVMAAISGAAGLRSTLAAAVVFTAPGIPMIFMGQEFLEWGAWSDATPLDWSKADRFSGIRTLDRDLIKLRRNGFGATRGLCGQGLHVHDVNNQDKVVGYHRWDLGGPRDDVVVIANFANCGFFPYKVGLPRGGVWRIRFNSDWSGYSPAFTNFGSFDLFAAQENFNDMPFSGTVGIGPYTALVLSQDA